MVDIALHVPSFAYGVAFGVFAMVFVALVATSGH